MTRRFARFAALLLAGLLMAAPAVAQGYPEEPGDGIADLANVLTPADADSIRAALYALRHSPGVEVRVLTVRSIDAFRTGAATPEAFATGVYNSWKLGYGQKQDGVLVLLSLDDRFTRIELGDEVPADKDAQMRAIVDDRMVPRFRDGDMSGGLRDGVLGIARAFGASVTAESPNPQPQPVAGAQDRPAGSGGGEGVVAGIIGLLVMGAGGYALVRLVRNRPRECAQCTLPMQRLDESADDVYLDSGRRVEEVLGSVNYDVWHCAGCGHHQVERNARWLSGKETCPQCSYRTVTVNRTVVEHPTYTSSGSQRVEKECGHCGWKDVDIIHLPRKQRPSSSSSSSSGGRRSFSSSSGGGSSRSSGGGGGSSSGRGSSGRW